MKYSEAIQPLIDLLEVEGYEEMYPINDINQDPEVNMTKVYTLHNLDFNLVQATNQFLNQDVKQTLEIKYLHNNENDIKRDNADLFQSILDKIKALTTIVNIESATFEGNANEYYSVGTIGICFDLGTDCTGTIQSLQILTPTQGNYFVNDSVNITWLKQNIITTNLYYSYNGGAWTSIISTNLLTYAYTVTQQGSYKFKVAYTDNVYTVSQDVFVEGLRTITTTVPETATEGDTININWLSANIDGLVDIYITNTRIAQNINVNLGIYAYQIPFDTFVGNRTIKVKSVTYGTEGTDTIVISAIVRTLTLTSPATATQGETKSISWTSSNITGNVLIKLGATLLGTFAYNSSPQDVIIPSDFVVGNTTISIESVNYPLVADNNVIEIGSPEWRILTTLENAPNLNDIQIVDNTIFIGGDGTNGRFVKLENDEVIIDSEPLPYPGFAFVYFISKDIGFIGCSNGGSFLKTINGGQTWLSRPFMGGSPNSMFFRNVNLGLNVGYYASCQQITNDGNTLYPEGGNAHNKLPVGSGNRVKMVTDTIAYCAGSAGIAKTIDFGLNWSVDYMQESNGRNDISIIDENNIFVAEASGKYSIKNNATWSTGNLPNASGSNMHGVHFINTSTGWIVGDNGNIFYTEDGGNTWVSQKILNFITSIKKVFMINKQLGYAICESGIILKYS